jgi:hypothetical protein
MIRDGRVSIGNLLRFDEDEAAPLPGFACTAREAWRVPSLLGSAWASARTLGGRRPAIGIGQRAV